MGSPFSLGQKQGCLHWPPSLTAVGVVILDLLLYVPFGTFHIVSLAAELKHGQLVSRYYYIQGSLPI